MPDISVCDLRFTPPKYTLMSAPPLIITITGTIYHDSGSAIAAELRRLKQFLQSVAQQHRKLIITLDSRGGRVEPIREICAALRVLRSAQVTTQCVIRRAEDAAVCIALACAERWIESSGCLVFRQRPQTAVDDPDETKQFLRDMFVHCFGIGVGNHLYQQCTGPLFVHLDANKVVDLGIAQPALC